MDKNPIPPYASDWGRSQVLTVATQEKIRTILEAAANQGDKQQVNRQRMGDFYASCMDVAAINTKRLEPVQGYLARIDAIQSARELQDTLIAFQLLGRPFQAVSGGSIGPFRFTSGPDPGNPDRMIARIVERDLPGLGTSIFSLPDRDYYLNGDAKSIEIRNAFVDHVSRMLELSGTAKELSAPEASSVLMFETALAESVMTIAEKRDPDKVNHVMRLADVTALAPNFDWALLLKVENLPPSTPINVAEPKFLKKIDDQLTGLPVATWKVWLRWRLLSLVAPYLPQPLADESFRFNRMVLRGVREQPPRWQTCATLVDNDLPDALGEAYVTKYFPPEAKVRVNQLVENLRLAMREELEQSDWMQASTKESALRKLQALRVEIGYPERWKDYATVRIGRGNFLENVLAAWTYGDRHEISLIGKPVDHGAWPMTATVVNAFSPPTEVKVVFPAGILQPPFFDPQADDAVNYGAIGAVIGHEIAHQFDDGGSRYDASAALKNWWTDEDRKNFEIRTACIVDQFNGIDLGEGLHHKGKQVLGEALGDLGGVSTAYRAWKMSLKGKAPVVLDGFTGEQRFFIAFARINATQTRPETIRVRLNSDNHPIARYRATATLQNMPSFQSAFQCKAGDPMTRSAERQCKIW